MNNLQQPHYSDRILNRLGLGCLVLFLVTYITHLGVIPLDTRTDEARRALVSLEMMLSGDYISPTLNGEAYLNKPPLYNWIMIGWLKASGSFSSFWLRFPVIVAIAVFGLLIYRYASRYTSKMIALVATFAFITNGRILIYDSFQGLIDLTFGFCMYWLMMLVFHFGEQKKYWQLFLFTYLLTAAGYMMKGLPALVFEAITLLVYFIYTRRFRVLFSIQHIVSILLLFAILGSYYYAYFQRNNVEPLTLFQNLLTESTKRTAVKYGFWYSVFHFLYYPFAMVYHYAPWMLLGVLLIRKDIFKIINANPFIKFNWWAFLFNFLVYWTSPEVYARYLFPLLAPLFTVLIYLFYTIYKPGDWQRKWPEKIFGWILCLAAAGSLVLPLTGAVKKVDSAWVKAIICALALGLVAWYYFKQPIYRLLTLCLALFLIRMGFNWFVIDQRGAYLRQMVVNADRIDSLSKGQGLFLERGINPGNFDGMSYHISLRRNEILRFSAADTTHLFITDSAHLAGKQYHSLFDFDNIYADHLWLVKYQKLK
jgi:4-amino-4-deoxy-L-arabinose transferase-like glycosyltransferase